VACLAEAGLVHGDELRLETLSFREQMIHYVQTPQVVRFALIVNVGNGARDIPVQHAQSGERWWDLERGRSSFRVLGNTFPAPTGSNCAVAFATAD
jgi:hypothetical protein